MSPVEIPFVMSQKNHISCQSVTLSPGNFKKSMCRPTESKGQGPHQLCLLFRDNSYFLMKGAKPPLIMDYPLLPDLSPSLNTIKNTQ